MQEGICYSEILFHLPKNRKKLSMYSILRKDKHRNNNHYKMKVNYVKKEKCIKHYTYLCPQSIRIDIMMIVGVL